MHRLARCDRLVNEESYGPRAWGGRRNPSFGPVKAARSGPKNHARVPGPTGAVCWRAAMGAVRGVRFDAGRFAHRHPALCKGKSPRMAAGFSGR